MSKMNTEVRESKEKQENCFNGEWIRKASTWETIMETGHRNGNFLIWYQLNLKSYAPLKEDHVRNALTHLYRKVPNLGVCLDSRDGSPWIKRSTNPNVDFKVLQGQSVEDVRNTLRTYRYKSDTGPLFCGRLLKDSPDKVADSEDLDPQMKYNYYMFFGFHHGVVDGTTNMYIMGFFISLLNDIISDKPINDDEPMGTYCSENETLKVVAKKRELIESNSSLRVQLSHEKELTKNQKPYIISGFQSPNEKMRTVSLDRILDQSTTSKFVQKCRQEKVTVNSTFTALVNVALVDILVENNVIRDSYLLQNFHLVNLRRYWEVKQALALGCHIGGPLTIFTETPRILDKFWDYVRSLHQTLKTDIESGKVLLDKAFYSLNAADLPFSEEFLKSTKQYEGDFVTSNLGNVMSLVTEGGEHVRISHVLRSTTIHMIENPVVINFHTFRGKFTMIFDYNAGAVKKEVAEKFCSQILKRLRGILD